MKHTGKIVVAVFVGLAAAGSLFAQNGRRDRWGPPSPPSAPAAAETVTVSGPLELVNGQIAVVDSGKTYYVGQLIRLVGFIEGLKEGAQVTLKGNAVRYPSSADSYRLWITTMTLNGKVYENLDGGRGSGPIMERSAPPRWGPWGG
ncbi:MAG: hypothetical protein LBG27_01840 [Spirochaetaceae bacterium]|jgi:hypothetical protein|nr:hypothetical protein [Spirochaetaceae bacterium]